MELEANCSWPRKVSFNGGKKDSQDRQHEFKEKEHRASKYRKISKQQEEKLDSVEEQESFLKVDLAQG